MEIWILSGMLGLYSIEDIRKRAITAKYLVLFGMAGVVLNLYRGDISVFNMFCGVVLGLFIVLISLVTRGSVGLGDGLLFIITGIFLGGTLNLELLTISLVYASLFSLGMIALGRKKKNQEIPFIPFVFVGYVTIVLGGLL